MKRIFYLHNLHRYYISLCVIILSTTVAYSGTLKYSFLLNLPTVTMTKIQGGNSNYYYILESDKLIKGIGTPGSPDIPLKVFGFLVPDGAGEFNVTVSYDSDAEFIPLEYPIYPIQNEWSDPDPNINSFVTPDDEIYNRNTIYCNPQIVNDIYINGKFHVVRVGVPVYGYNAVKGVIEKYRSGTLSLNYKDNAQPKVAIECDVTSELDDNLEEYIVNCPSQLKKVKRAIGDYTAIFPQYYYILTPENLLSSVEELAFWKKQKGFEVIVKTFEEILSLPESQINRANVRDEAEAVRNWLIEERKKNGRFYLSIIGDYRTSAPIRKFKKVRLIHEAETEKEWYNGRYYFPTDGYFSDMTTSYRLKLQPNGYYSALFDETPYYSPDLIVGRLLANANKDINTYLKKLLIYELLPKYKDTGYLNRCMMSRQYDFFKKNQRSLFENLTGFNDSIVLNDPVGGDDFNINVPTGKDIIDAMRTAGVISLKGHGSPSTMACAGWARYPREHPKYKEDVDYNACRFIQPLSWYEPKMRWLKHTDPENAFDNLHNEGRPGIIYSTSCSLVPFDDYKEGEMPSDIPYNMGGAYTLAGEFGGVAFIGNTRSAQIVAYDSMEMGFGENVELRKSIGDAHRISCFPESYETDQQYIRNLIGDPDIHMWNGRPTLNDIYITDVGSIVKLQGNLSDAKVFVYNGKETIERYTMGESKTSFILPNSIAGDFLISVYKDNSVPYLNLVSHNTVLSEAKQYILPSLKIGNDSKPSYHIISGGALKLKSLTDIESNNGFCVNNGGVLYLEAEGKVTLSNDVFKKGSKCIISASEVILDKGVVIEPGAEFEIKYSLEVDV